MNQHPCDGAWLVLDDVWRSCPAEALGKGIGAAADWGLTGLMASAKCLLAFPAALPDSLGVMELHGRAPERPADASTGPSTEADLWAVDPDQGLGAASALDLRAQRSGPCSSATEYMDSHPNLEAILLGRAEEDDLDALSRFDDLAVFVPGEEFASGYRLGAASHYGALAALHPWAAARASELAEEDVTSALDVERRLQRFLEAEIAPRLRQLGHMAQDRDALLLEVLGWLPVSEPRLEREEAEFLGGSLRGGVPELFEDAP